MLSSHVRIAVSLVYIISSSIAVIFVPAILAQSAGQATVIVKVTGLRSEKGQVRIAVFNSSEKWLGEQPVYSSTINVDSQSVTWKIYDVPYGITALRFFMMKTKTARWIRTLWGYLSNHTGFQIMGE